MLVLSCSSHKIYDFIITFFFDAFLASLCFLPLFTTIARELIVDILNSYFLHKVLALNTPIGVARDLA